MKNVVMSVSKDGILTIKVDLKVNNGKSASGKSSIIATTEGNVSLESDKSIKIGLNIYKPALA